MSPFPFADLPRTPVEHFKLYFYATVLTIIEQVSQTCGSVEAAFEQFPFLIGYNNELAAAGLAGARSSEAAQLWRDWLTTWESTAAEHLPLRALRDAAQLSHHQLTLFLGIGLIEEDARFGTLFETFQGTPGQSRPTAGLLAAWWQGLDEDDEAAIVIRRLVELGLVNVVNPEAPRMGWALQTPTLLWDAVRGAWAAPPASGLRYRAPHQLLTLDALVAPESLRDSFRRLPELLRRSEARTVIVRGPQANGRRTAVGTVARALGYGLLEIGEPDKTNADQARLIGPLATLLHAFPTFVLDLGPGETAELPPLNAYYGPASVILGKQGGVKGRLAEQAVTMTLEMPLAEERQRHWALSLEAPGDTLQTLAERFRLTSGNIYRVAKLAKTYAALAGHSAVTLTDAHRAHRTLNRQRLDALAAHLQPGGDWNQLAAGPETLHELHELELLCRHRERLGTMAGALGAPRNTGVRALFSGPSGTGKTLAAQLLAAALQMDVYRLDLSAIVNKYIGETEKNLNQVFARAEELNVILLLDEGDALLTQRTAVQSSNDRYANLETNYLLQRIESFEGILIVTTNAPDRIDGAFQRRMDVVVEFRPPDAAERWAIWQQHLPPTHTVELALLQEVAGRCSLTGGQIRNAALHAGLLALNNGGLVTSTYLEAAVRREYRKLGAVCPLRTIGS